MKRKTTQSTRSTTRRSLFDSLSNQRLQLWLNGFQDQQGSGAIGSAGAYYAIREFLSTNRSFRGRLAIITDWLRNTKDALRLFRTKQ